MNVNSVARNCVTAFIAVAITVFFFPSSATAGVRSAVNANGTGALCPAPPPALSPAVSKLQLAQASGKHNQGADMRDEGYNTQYIFGMTKAIAESTLNPGLKPLVFIFTIPLDLVTLPFTLIAGFF